MAGKAVTSLLVVICVILFLGCAALGILYALEVTAKGACKTSRCLEDASRISENLDTSVNPCDNFYKFACGNFPKEKQSAFKATAEEALGDIRRLLEEPVKDNSRSSAERKLKEYYTSCLESDVSEKKKMEELRKVMKKIGGFNKDTPAEKISLDDFSATYFQFDDSVEYFTSSLSTIFALTLDVKMETVGKNDDLKSYAKLGSVLTDACKPDQQQNDENDTVDALRDDAIKKAATEMAKCMDKDAKQPDKFAEDALEVHNILFNCKMDDVTDNIKNFTTKRLSWDDLVALFPWLKIKEKGKGIQWFRIFDNPFREWHHKKFEITREALITMKRLDEIYHKIEPKKFRNYLIYTFLSQKNRGMPKCISDAANIGRSFLNTPKKESKWRVCVDKVNTAFPLGVIALLEMKLKSPMSTDEKLLLMIDEIKEAVVERTEDLSWLDDRTKSKIERKVKDKVVMIAGPEEKTGKSSVDDFFLSLRIDKAMPFLVNDNAAQVFRNKMKAKVIASPELNHYVYIATTEDVFVNALNLLSKGGIVLYWPILQLPYYSRNSQEYLQYGAIGSIIGSGIGRDFDSAGKFKIWADKSDIPQIRDADRCVQDHYMGIKYPGWEPLTNQRANLSAQGIPDVLGLIWSMEAYEKHISDRGKEDKKLPGLPYSPEQLFHIASAQMWCNSGLSKAEVNDRVRVLGSTALNPFFADAFNCPAGSPMNAKNKCELW